MDFAFSEEQKMLAASARGLFNKEWSTALVRKVQAEDNGYSPDLWRKMAQLGWMGLMIPEKYGGMGLSFLDLNITIVEMGRALAVSPFISTVIGGGIPLLFGGSPLQKERFLPQIANGQVILTMAFSEPTSNHTGKHISVEAIPRGGDYSISGIKLFVPYAHIAEWILCIARTGKGKMGKDRREGISLFLVEGKSKGIRRTPLHTIAPEKQFEVIFDKVKVPRENVVGDLDQGWAIITHTLNYAAMAQCAYILGGMERSLEMTVSYAKERVQFGRPIGSFQAIQYKCADMFTSLEGAKFLIYQAAWKLSSEFSYDEDVSIAKAYINDVSSQFYNDAHQIFGAIGFTADHDLGLYSRRAKMAESSFGSTRFHHELVAQYMGL